MIESDASPGRFERLWRRVPDGTVLRATFYTLLAMAIGVVALDYRDMALASADTARSSRTEPVPLERPVPGDQIRPYLPKTIPVGPDRGEPRLPGYDGPVDGEAMAAPMRFVEAGGGILTAIGRIDRGSVEALRTALDRSERPIAALVIHSPGGSVSDAVAMARLVRERGLDTRVPADGYCASACPLLFSGGRERRAGAGAWIGVHQVYATDAPGPAPMRDRDRSISEIQATTAECQELLLDMGVDPAVWIKAMRTAPEDLYVLTEAELKELKVVTPERFGPPMPEALKPQA
ncbi:MULTISPECIES: hypothetical protein [unclassified Aureimonas]|uniref:COG3904 family protein n=1 Tax=unclassified Aureimonas TaxID=2615206 RepID=UPI000700F7CC|nr:MULTISPECIES: hypothetical protein [unclassified Aureimonas]KQT52799.1 hypothetical protein ASG62_12795 [Aureimonas sp. Leaf427]KQT80258.1 hypothetical protein ASG54_06645 [Aureimonas sp. Leaf460]